MTIKTRAKSEVLPATFSYSQARQLGISAELLYHMRDSGAIETLSRGLYRRADAPTIDWDLLEIAFRSRTATLCLVTALSRHGLIDYIPSGIDIALPRGTRAPSLFSASIRIHSFSRDTFHIGRETIKLEEHDLGIYSAERSIIDVIRLRHFQNSAFAWEALRNWLKISGNTPAAILKMSKHFRGAEQPLRNALEILL